MGSDERWRIREVKVGAAYCETRAANCERLAADHPDIRAQQQLLRIADEWRRWARDGMLRKLTLELGLGLKVGLGTNHRIEKADKTGGITEEHEE